MNDQELKQIAIDFFNGKIDIFSIEPFKYQYKSEQTNRGFYVSQKSLTKQQHAKVVTFFEDYKKLINEFVK